jgi:hypothetical protein
MGPGRDPDAHRRRVDVRIRHKPEAQMKLRTWILVTLAVAVASTAMLTACSERISRPEQNSGALVKGDGTGSGEAPLGIRGAMLALGERMNGDLVERGASFQLSTIEWLAEEDGFSQGGVLYFGDVGNKRLPQHFVPNDPRRYGGGEGDEITYLFDESDFTADLPPDAVDAAMERAMNTWRNAKCPTNLVRVADPGYDVDLTDYYLGFGGYGTPAAQVVHGGWASGAFPQGLIGVTYTFYWLGPDGHATDIDNDGRLDVAFREIYYNDSYQWGIDDPARIDVETVALHEMGHGLSQDHFGKLLFTTPNEKYHSAPRALMNSAYLGILHDLTGTDEAGHCAIWGSWHGVQPPGTPPVYLSEVYASHGGVDNQEYVELCGTPGTSLDGLWVIVIEGQQSANPGRIDVAWPLSGAMPADGFYVLADDGVPNQDYSIGTANAIENGTETVLLVQDLLYWVGLDIDTNDDGIAENAPGRILDGVGLLGDTADHVYYGVNQIGPDGPFFPAGAARCPDCAAPMNTMMCFYINSCPVGNVTPGEPNDCD